MAQDADPDVTPLQLMLSSWTGALLTSVIVTPLDVVKIRLQAQQKEFTKKKCFVYCNGLMDHLCFCNGNGNGGHSRGLHASASSAPLKWFLRPVPGHFNGTLDAFVKIVRSEGITSLWSGLPPTLVMALPATMVYFTVYDQLRATISKRNNYPKSDPPLWVSVLSGGLARTFAVTAISPLELVRTKMQSKKLRYGEVITAIRTSVQAQGVFSMWRGLGPTLLRDVPFSALYWFNYEFYKKTFNQTKPTFAFSFFAGAAAGTVCAVVTLPFDVVKTHRQIELGEKDILLNERKNGLTSTAGIMKKIYTERGVRGLFAGITPRVVKVAPACAIMISTYEFGKSFFKKLNQSNKTFMEFIMERN